MKTSALDEYLKEHRYDCRKKALDLFDCSCGRDAAETEVKQLRARIAELKAKLSAYEYFVISIWETFELHSSHWEFHVKKGLAELEEALNTQSAEEAGL